MASYFSCEVACKHWMLYPMEFRRSRYTLQRDGSIVMQTVAELTELVTWSLTFIASNGASLTFIPSTKRTR